MASEWGMLVPRGMVQGVEIADKYYNCPELPMGNGSLDSGPEDRGD